jgi:ribonuclease H2 subunit C
VKAVHELATFDEIVVWGHEVAPDSMEDVYVKGVEEWIGFAEAVSDFRAS